MSRSLIDRYTYGNSGFIAPFSAEAEIVFETPRREREMIQLGRKQVEAQNRASREIARSNIEGAQIIASEIAYQTEALGMAISQAETTISESVLEGARQVCESVDALGDRLCAELSEIRWQLAQQNETLERILAVLQHSRNNEARQLVQQGVRHYVNHEYEEAEERFKLALEFDTTDYQVLMNMAYIEIHKGNSSQAFTFFKKAISLPEHLDSASKARNLWATARLHYAENDYEQTFSYAEQALKHDDHNHPQALYKLGVYAALANKTSLALQKIESAISLDTSYFSKASADPDLETTHLEVLSLLGRLASNMQDKSTKAMVKADNAMSNVERRKDPTVRDNFIFIVRDHLNNASKKMQSPSYSTCLSCFNNMTLLQKVIDDIKNLEALYSKHPSLKKTVEQKKAECSALRARVRPPQDISWLLETTIPLMVYVLPGYLLANASAICDPSTPSQQF